MTLDGPNNYLRVRSLPNNGKGTIEFIFLIDQVKLLYTKFSESTVNWMNELKSNSMSFSAYDKSNGANRFIVDFRFDESYKVPENNLFAILEKHNKGNRIDYQVYICKINFDTDPANKDSSINKIIRLDQNKSEIYNIYPRGFENFYSSAFFKVYYSSREGKVFLLGLCCEMIGNTDQYKTEYMDVKTQTKFHVECRMLSKQTPETLKTLQARQDDLAKSTFTSFNHTETIAKILGSESSQTIDQGSLP